MDGHAGPSWPPEARVAAALVVFAFGAAALWLLSDPLGLLFSGVLLAAFLRLPVEVLVGRAGITRGWALALVLVSLAGLAVIVGLLIAPQFAEQFDELLRRTPQALAAVRAWLSQWDWGRVLLESARGDILSHGPALVGRATGWFSSTLSSAFGLLVILFLGIFIAIEPGTYAAGAARLLPAVHRPRARAMLAELDRSLQWWLIGKVISMIATGVLVFAGLAALGMPLAATLALIAGLLTFVPNLGPVLGYVPAGLVALLDSPARAAQVGALYLAVQLVEGYVINPVVQRHTLSLPPALTLGAQVLLGVFLGGFGVVIAAPLTVVGVVLVRELYQRDVLEERVSSS